MPLIAFKSYYQQAFIEKMNEKLVIIDHFHHFTIVNSQIELRAFNSCKLNELKHIEFSWYDYL